MLAAGVPEAEILKDYDFLEPEDIRACLEFAAEQVNYPVLVNVMRLCASSLTRNCPLPWPNGCGKKGIKPSMFWMPISPKARILEFTKKRKPKMDTDERRFFLKKILHPPGEACFFAIPSDLCLSVLICGSN